MSLELPEWKFFVDSIQRFMNFSRRPFDAGVGGQEGFEAALMACVDAEVNTDTDDRPEWGPGTRR